MLKLNYIINRINFFILITKYILSIKEPNNCMKIYNIDEKTKVPTFKIGNNIILDKQIGLISKHGIIYIAHFKTNIEYKFAVKITSQSNNNKIEIEILNKLTKIVFQLKCPHFPITYGILTCNDYYLLDDNKYLFPKLIKNNKNLYIQINELAEGDLHTNLISKENKK